jgi:hypothetical protein
MIPAAGEGVRNIHHWSSGLLEQKEAKAMNKRLVQIKRTLRRWFAPGNTHRLDFAKLGQLARGIFATRPDEIDCDECFERLDRFAEMIKAGNSPSQAMSLVQNHLEQCPDCRQEFVSLMTALRADPAGEVLHAFSRRPLSSP